MARGDSSQPALRAPGQYARERGLELSLRPVLIAVLALLAMLIAWQGIGLRGISLVLFELGAIGTMASADRLYSDQAGRWLRGAEGERVVGEVCAELKGNGWHAIHDVSLGHGNVDHILVGPGGIFTIETKSHPGHIPIDHIDPKMLKQAYAEKKLLERITGLDVQPLLVFSRAYLVGSVPAQRGGVTILPARMLEHYFSRRRPVMAAEHADQVHRRLAIALSA
jgi:hypothetical protein